MFNQNLNTKIKKQKILFAVIPFICFLFIKCSKLEQINNTQLLITLKDTAGNYVSGATVRLYKNAADSGITKISDAGGMVLFSNLELDLYYWLAEKGCQNNRNRGQITTPRPLVLGTVSYGYSTLTKTGILLISNISTEPYLVSDSLFSITLNDTTYITYPEVGSYIIHSEKVSTPGIGKDTLIQITCGVTTILTLPY
jgi:hypothetical protein